MNKKKILSDIIRVSLSNLSTLISGILVGFIIPKILGITEYGYYKIFTLYASYIGLFSFGISEGLYLKYSGTEYKELNKPKTIFITKLFSIIQFIIMLLMMIAAIIFAKGEYRFIIIALSIYLIEVNITTYYQYVAQMTLRFKDYTIRNFIKTILTIAIVIIMALLYYYNGKSTISYKYYVVLTVCISTFLYFLYLKKFKDITIGKSETFDENKRNLKEIIKNGFPFLLATLCSTLILNIDKQFVSTLFKTSVYGIYAFAYSMLTLVTMFTAAVSTVLYPTLKKTSKSNMNKYFNIISSFVLVFVFFALILYYPLTVFVEWFLPKYQSSLQIFRIIFPGLAFTSVISVVYQNYYKLLEKNTLFLKQNIFILIISIVANLVAYLMFKTPAAISIASIFVLFIYYNISEHYFRKELHVEWKRKLIYIILLAGGFYIITSITNIYISMVIYILYFIIITKIVMPNTMTDIKQILKKKGE